MVIEMVMPVSRYALTDNVSITKDTNNYYIYTTIGAVCKCVFTLPSSRLDENLPVRSQFYSDHRVNLCTYPLLLDRSLFAFILCFYDQKSSKKQQCGENATNGVNYEVLSANVKRPAGLLLSDPRIAADLEKYYKSSRQFKLMMPQNMTHYNQCSA